MKKVLMLHTGGTLGMSGRRPTPLKPDVYTHQLLTHVPELKNLADVEVQILWNMDSSNVTPRHWEQVSQLIADKHNAYDGFVVIHGTDTMAYTASACAFRLEGLRKPVIFTGSQRPLGETRSDARSNLVGAVELATQDVPEVGIFFNSRLLRAVRTVKSDVWQYDAFTSPNCGPLAEVGVDLVIRSNVRQPTQPFALRGAFESRVACLELHPGFEPSILDAVVGAGMHGMVLRAFGSGNVPIIDHALPPAIRRAVARNVPVVIVTQVMRGGADLALYECGLRARDAGAIDGADLTTPAAVVKLMWALGEAPGMDAVRATFAQDLRGEGGPLASRRS
ncbi:MAG: asparaginase [Myxococcota bacterium]